MAKNQEPAGLAVMFSRQNRRPGEQHGFTEVSTCKNKKVTETHCARCFSPIKAAIDSDSRQFFSNDLFCRCERRPR